jgi:hypothetical protein
VTSSPSAVKPAALIANAIRDCTRRNEAVLDAFRRIGQQP